MKAFWARLRPDTLFGQLLLMLCLGIALLQGINFFILQNIQQSYVKQTMTDRVNITASRFLLMDSFTVEQRAQALSDLARYYDDSWNVAHTFLPSIGKWNSEADTDSTGGAAGVVEALQKRLIEKGMEKPPEIRVRLFRTYPASPVLAANPYLARIFTELDLKRFPVLEIAMQLRDGTWLSIMQSMQFDDANVVWIQRVQLAFVAVVFAALLGMILIRVTWPLRQLSLAAVEFGKQPNAVRHLQEKGSREMREAARSFNMMRQAIQGNLSERDRMLAAMAHDLRTPLARMKLRIGDLEDEESRKGFSDNCDEILSIVNQGLELARSLHTTEEPITVNMQAFVQSIVDDCMDEGGNISVHMLAPASTTVTTRPVCLKRCVSNLLANSLRYAGSAEVILSTDQGAVTLDILDDGPGIPEEELKKVFEPYYRLESSRNRNSGGIGLGLSIANNMACLSNAELTLRNRKERGLQARLTFAAPTLS